jgi:hypothetical protein
MGGTSCKLIWAMLAKSKATTGGAIARWVGGSCGGCGDWGWGGCKLILAMLATLEATIGGSPAGSVGGRGGSGCGNGGCSGRGSGRGGDLVVLQI